VYLSVPAPKKMLPQPCPQCGLENGGCQWVIFNPRYYKKKTYYSNTRYGWSVWEIPKEREDSYERFGPYTLLRISHYSKERYSLAQRRTMRSYRKVNKTNRSKVWHTFQMPHAFFSITLGEKEIDLREIFNRPAFKFKHSISFGMSREQFDYYKENGWPKIKLNKAHWVNSAPRFEDKRRGRKKRVRLDGYL
jgi:hypothetical protein